MFPSFETVIRKIWGRVRGGWIRTEVQKESKETCEQHAEGLCLLQLAITQEGHRTREDTKENKDNKKCQELLIVQITSCKCSWHLHRVFY